MEREPVTGDVDARGRRVAHLLAARLEGLAVVSERSGFSTRWVERGVLALEAATRHAVALGLLSAAEAARIWVGVARRHPDVRWGRPDPTAIGGGVPVSRRT